MEKNFQHLMSLQAVANSSRNVDVAEKPRDASWVCTYIKKAIIIYKTHFILCYLYVSH